MEDLTDKIKQLVDDAMRDHLSNRGSSGLPFLNPQDYKDKTGRRFRMNPDQKARGITREQAFEEFVQKLLDK